MDYAVVALLSLQLLSAGRLIAVSICQVRCVGCVGRKKKEKVGTHK